MKVEAVLPLFRLTPTIMKMAAAILDITVTRTGVPRRRLNTPNQPANAPS